jgi:hypothetical protein
MLVGILLHFINRPSMEALRPGLHVAYVPGRVSLGAGMLRRDCILEDLPQRLDATVGSLGNSALRSRSAGTLLVGIEA